MKSESSLHNQLKAIRTRLGLSQQDLAAAAGITRQTVGGIEARLYAPSAAVALRLARALGCRVEDLFWLEEDLLTVEAAAAETIPESQSVRVTLAQVAGRWIAHPLLAERAFRSEMIPADGIGRAAAEKTFSVQLLDDPEPLKRTVLIAGCTPALSLWARSAERWYPGLRIHWIHANSTAALHSLARGEIHAAGVHLYDPDTGKDNAPYVQQVLAGREAVLVHLGAWEEGMLVQPENPKEIRRGSDMARQEVVLVNREEGAGSRLLLDHLLKEANISPARIRGYRLEAHSHQEVARTIHSGQADVGVSTAAMAALYGLSFVPLRSVRYDLVFLKEYLLLEPIQQLLSTLHHRRVLSQLKMLGGYDIRQTGEMSAVEAGV